jgi:CRP/FNR family cyclic AMP-dependent transcriptional regulator
MNDNNGLLEALAGVPLLRRLNKGQQERLAHRAARRSYKVGDIIVRQGDTSMSFYVLLAGSVEFRREVGPRKWVSVGGAERGGCFGELELIDDQPRDVTVVALEPSEFALLSKWDFENELRKDPEIALALLPILTGRIRELETRLEQAAPQPA